MGCLALDELGYHERMNAPFGHNRRAGLGEIRRMFAIVFDLDTNVLRETYPNQSWNNACSDIRKVLEDRGFEWQQGSTYFGNANITAVDCVIAVQALRREYEWFKPSVRDVRMLRIEDNNDLMPALD
jgi:virulence-associated protein VapD